MDDAMGDEFWNKRKHDYNEDYNDELQDNNKKSNTPAVQTNSIENNLNDKEIGQLDAKDQLMIKVMLQGFEKINQTLYINW